MHNIKYKDFFNDVISLNENTISSEIEKQIIDLYASGLSTLKIAKELKIGQRTVLQKLIKHNITRRQHSNKITPETEKEIIKLYLDGQSTYQIAKIFNLNGTSVRDFLKKRKIPLRSASDALLTYNTNRKKDNFRQYHSTRTIGQGTVTPHHIDGLGGDNTGSSREIPKRLGGHPPE